jgi:wobble nucleotide-excising tRNase
MKKIIRIENVGKFKKCAACGDVTLRKLNLIYAGNGRGKTTFCDILRSLQTGNGELIHGRGTLGEDGDPFIDVLFDKNITFRQGSWSDLVPNIAIFDDTFVYENVHAGEFVQHDQKRGLYNVIVGAAGVALQRKVDELDEQGRTATKELKEAQNALQGYLPPTFKEAAFLTLAPDADIDSKIAEQQRILKAVEHAATIASKPALAPLVLPAFPGELAATLATTLAAEADTETRIRTHLDEHTQGATQAWVAEGLRYEQDDDCPFCGQETSHLDLVRAYRAFFGQEYTALQTTVSNLRKEVARVGDEGSIVAIQRALEQNQNLAEFWGEFTTLTPPTVSMDDLTQALKEYAATAGALMQTKAEALLERIGTGPELERVQRSIEAATAMIQAYNTAVEEANRLIERKKHETGAADAAAVRGELARLEATKKRYEPDVDAACQRVLAAKQEKKRFDGEKKQAKNALDQHGNTILPKFQGHINRLLQNFGVGFSVQNVERSYAGGRASSSYQLLINQVPVDLGDASTSVGEPSFRNTLSAGDRRTLALAFFITQLQLDPALHEKLIILDDPFTSQDSSRRWCTQQQICRLASKADQVVVLSHEASFLASVHEAFPTTGEIKTLQLTRVGGDETTISEWDITTDSHTTWEKDVRTLQGYVNESEGDALDVVRAIRPTLEGYLRSACKGSFLESDWLGDFISKIRNADEDDPASNFRSMLDEIEDINDYSKRYHHSKDSTAGNDPIDDNELRAFAQRALKVVGTPP